MIDVMWQLSLEAQDEAATSSKRRSRSSSSQRFDNPDVRRPMKQRSVTERAAQLRAEQ